MSVRILDFAYFFEIYLALKLQNFRIIFFKACDHLKLISSLNQNDRHRDNCNEPTNSACPHILGSLIFEFDLVAKYV